MYSLLSHSSLDWQLTVLAHPWIAESRTASGLWRRTHQPAAAAIPKPAGLLRLLSTSDPEPVLNKKLDGKVAIITGAARGIGAETARLFAAHGAQVILADISDEKGHQTGSEIGSNAHYRHCDASKEEDVASTVDFAVKKFGKLDIMYNNAGIAPSQDTFQDLNLDDYDRVTSLMVRGVISGIKHASRVMIPASKGVILSSASTASIWAADFLPLVYNLNKSSLPGLTRIAAYRLGKHGIRVNAISPHAILTPLLTEHFNKLGVKCTYEEAEQAFIRLSSLLGKRCTVEDVAKGALFLCSDDSAYVSGQNLIVDGGWCNSKEYPVVEDLLNAMKGSN